MSVLVTGATGFLGSHVARLLVDRGEPVRVLVRPATSRRTSEILPGTSVEAVSGDLRDASSLEAAMRGVRVVYHVAADYRLWARRPADIYDSNVTGTRNVLDAARRARVSKVVYTSTVGTIAVPRDGSLPDENTQTLVGEMIGHYKRSKWLAEQDVLRAAADGLPVVIVNPTTPVGPGDGKPTPTGRILVDFLNGRMPAYVDSGLNFVPVEDAAAGHLLAADHGDIGERYILGGENLTLKQVLGMLARSCGRRAPRVRLPHAVALSAGYVDAAISKLLGREPRIPLEGVRIARHSMFVNDGRARRELGFAPGAVAGALERAVRWYEANGYVGGRQAGRIAEASAA